MSDHTPTQVAVLMPFDAVRMAITKPENNSTSYAALLPYDDYHENMCLISAAPDLLAIVELLIVNHDVELHLSWDKCDCEIATLGRAAIAKAKGEPCPTE